MRLSAIPNAVRHHAEERSLPSPGGMVEYYFLSMITDFRLKVFETVARRLNLRARRKNCSSRSRPSPGISRNWNVCWMPVCSKGRGEGLP
ncbi:hypothetical protein M5E88_09105 [Akkermansia muciniphila]|nr:hypothetical protein M5E88_09105 [Akkermansia muciniphila]